MDGWTEERMKRWTDGRRNDREGGRMDGQLNGKDEQENLQSIQRNEYCKERTDINNYGWYNLYLRVCVNEREREIDR